MNLYLRLLWLWIAGRRRSHVPLLGPCRTPFRVRLPDLDLFRHMNNAKYFALMDLARVDLLQRAGFLPKLFENGIYPVVTAESMIFRKSLNWRQRFDIETTVVSWDDTSMLLAQRFLLGETEVASGLVRARFLRRQGGTVPTSELIALSGEAVERPIPPAWLPAWEAAFTAGMGDAHRVVKSVRRESADRR